MKRKRGHPKAKAKAKAKAKVCLYDQNRPEFFEVFIPEFNSHQLCIPADFHEHFGGRIPEKIILKDIGGKVWHVDFQHDGKGLFFTNGWQRFVKDTSLELGNFMVFRYNTSLDFTVRIFGNSGCKKIQASESVNNIFTFVKKEEESEPEPTPVRKEHYSQKSHTISKKISGLKIVSPGKPRITSKLDDKRQHVEINQAALPEDLCFTTCLGQNRAKLHIPNRLLKKYHINLKQEVVLRNHTGKLWPVKASCTHDQRRVLTEGWLEFCEENGVWYHDKLEFQCILSKGSECKEFIVRIIRKGGEIQ